MTEILPLTISMPMGDTVTTIHPTLLRDGETLILVDCGFVGALPLLETALACEGLSADQLSALVLTHQDHDHMGAAAALKRRNPRIKLYASAEEAPYIEGTEKSLRLQQAEELQQTLPPDQQAFGEAFCALLRRVEPVAVDCLLTDGQLLDGIDGCRVLATPGHTSGHLSLYLPRSGSVITGDAIALENGRPVLANPQFALDLLRAGASMERLLALSARAYYCYHGGLWQPAVI